VQESRHLSSQKAREEVGTFIINGHCSDSVYILTDILMNRLFGYSYIYESWYNIFLFQQINHTNQHKRLIDQPNKPEHTKYFGIADRYVVLHCIHAIL